MCAEVWRAGSPPWSRPGTQVSEPTCDKPFRSWLFSHLQAQRKSSVFALFIHENTLNLVLLMKYCWRNLMVKTLHCPYMCNALPILKNLHTFHEHGQFFRTKPSCNKWNIVPGSLKNPAVQDQSVLNSLCRKGCGNSGAENSKRWSAGQHSVAPVLRAGLLSARCTMTPMLCEMQATLSSHPTSRLCCHFSGVVVEK